jgi:hypothetical protein
MPSMPNRVGMRSARLRHISKSIATNRRGLYMTHYGAATTACGKALTTEVLPEVISS